MKPHYILNESLFDASMTLEVFDGTGEELTSKVVARIEPIQNGFQAVKTDRNNCPRGHALLYSTALETLEMFAERVAEGFASALKSQSRNNTLSMF